VNRCKRFNNTALTLSRALGTSGVQGPPGSVGAQGIIGPPGITEDVSGRVELLTQKIIPANSSGVVLYDAPDFLTGGVTWNLANALIAPSAGEYEIGCTVTVAGSQPASSPQTAWSRGVKLRVNGILVIASDIKSFDAGAGGIVTTLPQSFSIGTTYPLNTSDAVDALFVNTNSDTTNGNAVLIPTTSLWMRRL